MAQNFTLTLTDGVAPATNIQFGTYNLAATVTGYTGVLAPNTLKVPDDITNGALNITLAGNAILTLIIYGPNTTIPVSDATFTRYTTATSTTAYTPAAGVVDTTGSSTGIYIIQHLPYEAGGYDVFLGISSATLGLTNEKYTINMTSTAVSQTINLGVVSTNATLYDDEWVNGTDQFPLSGTVAGTVATP